MAFLIEDGDELVDYIKNFTGSTNNDEIKQCIFLAEMAMRNIELPALRTNPLESLGTANADGNIPIPSDMNKPILFYNQGGNGQPSSSGPWIIYDRIGDRDMLGAQLVAPYYLNPVNVPTVIRGKFSEVGQFYTFLPLLSEGTIINLYYYKSWPLLFTPYNDLLIAAAGTVGTISGSGPWTATISGMSTTAGVTIGSNITATNGTGSIGSGGTYTVTSKTATSVTYTATGGTTPVAGTVTNINLTNLTVESNAVLQSWPEGYVYGTLTEYYIKRHNAQDAAVYKQKFDEAWRTVNNQNNLGKWSGGHTRLTSIFQPRRWFQYAVK